MLVINTWDKPLPTPFELDQQKLWRYQDLQRREHLVYPEGNEGNLMMPLSRSAENNEMKELEDFRSQEAASRTPLWDGLEFPFAAKGEPGQCLDLSLNIAKHLASTNPHLKIVDEPPPGKNGKPIQVNVREAQDRTRVVAGIPEGGMARALGRASEHAKLA